MSFDLLKFISLHLNYPFFSFSIVLQQTDFTKYFNSLRYWDALDDNNIYTAFEGISKTILPTRLLSNDADVEGDSLSIIGVNSSDGTVVINTEGNIEFTPTANSQSLASFDYTVTDGINNSVASVEVAVNPINNAIPASNYTISLDEDTFLVISANELLINDSDVGASNLSIIGVGNSNKGITNLNGNGNIEFTPQPNFNGVANLSYTVTDGVDNATASVELVVNPINDPVTLVSSIPNLVVSENAPNTVIVLSDYFEDIENGDNLGYSVRGSASFSGGTSGKFFSVFDLSSATKSLILGFEDGVVGSATIIVEAFDSGNESVETSFDISLISSTNNDDLLVGENGNDYLAGLGGKDTLEGNDGDDTLNGDGGDDILFGHVGNDILLGGSGNDTLEGGSGDDTYSYSFGFGADVIEDFDYSSGIISDGGNSDTLRFESGITRDNLRWSFAGDDLIFTLTDSPSDRLTILNYTDSRYGIENIEVDGSLLTSEEILNPVWSREYTTIGEFGRVNHFDHHSQTIEFSQSSGIFS